jgi:beta-galactosidase
MSEETAQLRLKARLVNDSRSVRQVIWSAEVVSPDGKILVETRVALTLPAQEKPVELVNQTTIERPILWSPARPALYQLRHRILDAVSMEVLDAVDSPLGFRYFHINADNGFFLNGEHCFIRGVGRHQDFEGLGYAVPLETLVADTRAIRTMGANAMRSHYPMADAVYSECDRSGLIVWAKIPVMDKITESLGFFENSKLMFKELILQMKKHPSIIFLGYACEILGDADWFWPKPQNQERLQRHFKEVLRFCRELEYLAKQLDPQRLTCNDFHSNPTPAWYQAVGLTNINDVNGWNVYHGWYHRNLSEIRRWLESTRDYAPKKPYLLAEFGAGVDERIRAHDPSIFDMSPEYADRFHRAYREVTRTLPWMAGVFIWTWSDFQRTSLGDSMKHINNKGMLTNRRCPKDAYYQYRAWWTKEPMVRIAGHARPRLAGTASHNGTIAECIRVYSNQKQVELFINGSSLGTRMTEDGMAAWQVEFTQGSNQLLARSGNIDDFLEIRADLFPSDLRQWKGLDQHLCINVGQSRFTYYDQLTDRVWLPDRDHSVGNYGHRNGCYYRSWPDMPAWDGIRDGVNRHIRGTENQPIYQSFLIGLDEYKVDLPRGQYEVTLLFCEPFDAETRRKNKIPHGAATDGSRVFDVLINNRVVLKELNLAEQYGELSAMSETFRIEIGDASGLTVGFRPVKGLPLLNGVSIRPLTLK